MADKTIRAAIALDGEREFTAGIRNINSELKQLGAESKLIKEEFKGQEQSIEAVTRKNENLQRTIDANKQKYAAYDAQIKKTQQEQDRIKKSVEDLTKARDEEAKKLEQMKSSGTASSKAIADQEKKVKELDSAIRQGNENLDRCNTRMAKYKKAQTDAQTAIAKSTNEIKKNNSALEESGKSVQKADEALSDMAAALVAAGVVTAIKETADALKECTDAAQQFETAFAKVSTIADTTVLSSDQLKSQIMELSDQTGRSVNDIAEATYQAISASVDTAEAVGFVGTATKLASGGFTDQATAVDTLTTVINAYGKQASDAEHISDLLIETQNKGKTTVAQLAQSYGQLIPSAASAGVSFEDLSTAMAVTTKNGMNTAISATSLRALLGELTKAGSNVSRVLTEQTGKSFTELVQSGKSLGDIMDILMQSANGDATAFKNYFSNVRSGGAAYFLAKEGADGYNAELERMNTVSGQAAQAAATMADTAQVAENKFKNSAENFKIAVGDALLPVLTSLEMTGKEAFDWMTDFVRDNPAAVDAIVGTATALGILAAGLTTVVVIVPKIKEAIASIQGAFAGNPATLAILGITAAIGGVIAAFEAWNARQAEIEGTQQNLQKTFQETNQSLRDNARAREEALSGVKEEQAGYGVLIDKLKELRSADMDATEKKERMKVIVDQLASVVPEVAAAFDAETGALSLTNAQLDQYAAKSKNAAIAAAMQDSLKTIATDLGNTELQLQKASDAADKYKQKMIELASQGLEGSAAYMNANSAWRESEQQIEALTGKQAELNEEFSATTDFINKHADAAKTDADAAGDAADSAQAYADAMSDTGESANATNESLEKLKSAIEGATNAFDEFNGGAKLSSQQILSNLQSQVSGMESWASNMKKIAGRAGDGVTQEFLDYLKGLGPGQANAIASIANASSKDLKKITKAWKKSGKNAADSYAKEIDSLKVNTKKAKKKGQQVGEAVAEGAKSSKKKVKKAYEEATDTKEVKTDSSKKTGDKMAKDTASGLNKGKGKVKSAAQSAVASANKVNTSGSSAVGAGIARGIASGINSNTSFVQMAARSAVNKAVAAAKAQAGVHSPSTVFRDEVGIQLTKGMAIGILNGSKEAQDASIQVMNDTINAAMKEGEIHSPSRKWKKKVGEQMANGIAMGIKAKKKTVEKHGSDIANKVTKAAAKWLKKQKATGEAQAYLWKKLLKDSKKQGGRYYKAIKKEVANRQKAAADTQFKAASATIKQIGTYNEKRIRQQIKHYQKEISNAKKYGKAYADQMKKNAKAAIKELKAEIEARKEYAASGGALSTLKTYYNTSAKQDLQYWETVRKNAKLSNAQRLEADRNYYEAVTAYQEQMSAAQEAYAEKVKSINEDLKKNIEDLNKAYEDAVDSSTKTIFNAYKLTDTFLSESESGKQLLANLKMQVWGYREWQKELEKIRKKFAKQNLNDSLLEELIEMGPEATATIRALNDLSADELAQYSQLYTEKLKIARTEAEKQNEQLKKDTQKQIADLKKTAKKEIETAKDDLTRTIASINKPMSAEMKKLADHAADWGTDVITSFVQGMKTTIGKKETWSQVVSEINKELKDAGITDTKASAETGSTSTAKKATATSAAKKATATTTAAKKQTITDYIATVASSAGSAGKKFTAKEIKSAGLDKPGAKAMLKDVKGTIGANGNLYFNTAGKKSVVKQWDLKTGKITTIKYDKDDYKNKAKASVAKYVHAEFKQALHNRGVKGYATGGMVNQLIRMEYGHDQGLIPAQLGEAVLSRQFAQNMVPRFTLAVERVTNALESIPTPAPLNRITAPSSQTAVTGGRDLGQMAGLMAQVALLLQQYLPDIADRDVVLDSGAMVGELSPRISADWAGIRRRSR